MKTTTVYQARSGLDTAMTLIWGYQNYHAITICIQRCRFFVIAALPRLGALSSRKRSAGKTHCIMVR